MLVTSVIHFFSLYAERYVVNAHDKQLYEEMLKSGEISTENKELIFLLNAKYDTVNEKNAFKENAENYDVLAKYLIDSLGDRAEQQYVFRVSNEDENLRLSIIEKSVNKYLDMDEAVSAALSGVYYSFIDNIGSIECIRICDGKIVFEVIDGTSSIINFIDAEQIPKDICKGIYHTTDDFHLEKLKGNWYVMVK